MQGLADGYFVLPYTIGEYLSDDIRVSLPKDAIELRGSNVDCPNMYWGEL